MAQGKAWDKEKVIRSLEPHFKRGCSVTKACNYAGIPVQTVDTWIQKDDELRIKITAWQNELSDRSRQNVSKRIKAGKEDTSWKWLERKERDEFMPREGVELGGEVEFKSLYESIFRGDKRQESREGAELRASPQAEGSSREPSAVQDTGGGEEVREEPLGSVSGDQNDSTAGEEGLDRGPDERPDGEDLAGGTQVESQGDSPSNPEPLDSEGELANRDAT